MRWICLPESEISAKLEREDYIDRSQVESFQAYNRDGTITIVFKSGTSLKYGPYSPEAYDELIDVLTEE